MKINKVPSVSLEILVPIYTSPDNGSVNSKRAHPPQAFVIFFLGGGKAAKTPWWGWVVHTKTPQWGLKKCANAPPCDNTKIAFSTL